MTTQEIERHDQGGALALAPTPSEAVTQALNAWVGGMALSVQGAEFMVDTPMCPDSFWPLPAGTKVHQIPDRNPKIPLPDEPRESYLARRKVATYTLGGIVRFGLQIGLPPEVAVQGIFMIGGRPSMYAEQMVALVKSHGHGHRVIERTAERCVVEVRRAGSQDWHRFEFTFEQAVRAGYVPRQGPNTGMNKWGKENTGGNEKYLTDPPAMLYARCSSIACRTEFPDVLRGLVSYEEATDERAAVPVDVTVEETAPRTSAAALLARATPEPAAAPAAAPVAPAAPAVPEPEVTRYVLPVSKPRLDAIGKMFADIGIGGRSAADGAARLAVVNAIVRRDDAVTHARELTSDEGALVQDNLTGDAGRSLCARVLDRPDLMPPTEAEAEAEAHAFGHYDEQLPDATTEPGWQGEQA